MNESNLYEVPEILPGDLIECLETGGQGIIREFGGGSGGWPRTWSITPLPGARIKCAWWHLGEFKVVQKGPAHEGCASTVKPSTWACAISARGTASRLRQYPTWSGDSSR